MAVSMTTSMPTTVVPVMAAAMRAIVIVAILAAIMVTVMAVTIGAIFLQLLLKGVHLCPEQTSHFSENKHLSFRPLRCETSGVIFSRWKQKSRTGRP